MEIRTKRELKFFLAADRIMNGYQPTRNLRTWFHENLFVGSANIIVIRYLRHLRKYAYYYNTQSTSIWNKSMMVLEHMFLSKYAIKTGFSIGANSLDYGIVIPHHGTIVVNQDSRVGPFSVLHTCTCIAGGGKVVGEGFYLSTGSQLIGEFTIGNNMSVAAHSLVNKGCNDNVLLAGSPAVLKKENYQPWYIRDGKRFEDRVNAVRKLKLEMFL